jgi:hypothetical protein
VAHIITCFDRPHVVTMVIAMSVVIGVAQGLFEVPDSIDTHNDEVARLFTGVALP